MKKLSSILTLCVLFNLHAEEPKWGTIELPPLERIYHPVSSKSKEVQKYFDKGLTNIFAFNHDLAYESFKKASELDPNLAMAYWGMALALGQNINDDVTREKEQKAYDLMQTALKLAPQAQEYERDYIKALAPRYTDNPNADLVPLRYVYRNEMKKLVDKYPDDLDAACLYAESILDLNAWKYWTLDKKPEEGTLEAIAVLEYILRRNPNHLGANHYLIHACEASPTPEKALLSAYRLVAIAPPDSGHLLHMPAHIFLLVGEYQLAIKSSQKAVESDRKYIQEHGMKGDYPLHYLTHNLRVMVRSYMLAEEYENALKAAQELNQFLMPHYKTMPHLTQNMIAPLEIFLYFNRWDDLLAYKFPDTDNPFPLAYWHFSRATAYANLNDLPSAKKEMDLFNQLKVKVPESDEILQNSPKKIFEIAELILNASFAKAKNDSDAQLSYLTKAVNAQDHLNYGEPPAWFMPIRIQLGHFLLEKQRYKEAENVFRDGLRELQRNTQLLQGLYLSLKKQNQNWNAFWILRDSVP